MIEATPAHTNQLPHAVRPISANSEKVNKAAQQFESVLLGNLFQKLQDSVSLCSGEDEDSSSKSFGELGVEQLAITAAKSGGIGISSMVIRYLEGNPRSTGSDPSPLKLFKDAPINEMYWQSSEVVHK